MAENPNNATSTKCFSGIFQRLLCGGSLPTHPCDQFKEQNRTTFDHSSQKLPFKTEANISNKVTVNSPGIVAKLMGLDSLPEEEDQKTNIGSFSRSKSVNSLDYLMKFNLTEQFHHRRIRTSVSFREIPNFDQEFKSEFLVFCFNNNDEEEKQRNQEMKPKNDSRKNVQKREQNRIGNKVKKQVKFDSSVFDQCKKAKEFHQPSKYKTKESMTVKATSVKARDYPTKMSIESKVDTKKKKKKKKSKSKCVVSTKIQPLFNSSDSRSIRPSQQVAIPAVNKGKKQLNSRKSPPRATDPEHVIITSKVEKQKEISKETDYYYKVLGEICRLTQEELNESHWITTTTGGNSNFEEFEELCLHFGQEVLDLLLDQVVHDLLIFG